MTKRLYNIFMISTCVQILRDNTDRPQAKHLQLRAEQLIRSLKKALGVSESGESSQKKRNRTVISEATGAGGGAGASKESKSKNKSRVSQHIPEAKSKEFVESSSDSSSSSDSEQHQQKQSSIATKVAVLANLIEPLTMTYSIYP